MKKLLNKNKTGGNVFQDSHRDQKGRYPGVTLIETLLYLALTSVMLVVITGSFNSFLKTRSRALVRSEVDTQAGYVVDRIEYLLQNAESVSIPASLGSGNTITFVENGQVGSSTIALNSDKLRITPAVGGAQDFSNNRVSISSLQFSNRAPVGEPPLISISFTIAYKGGQGPEFVYSKSYQTTVLVRDY